MLAIRDDTCVLLGQRETVCFLTHASACPPPVDAGSQPVRDMLILLISGGANVQLTRLADSGT